jgi:hypothetical protein
MGSTRARNKVHAAAYGISAEGRMERKDLASKCWDGANGVTAFACAQMVAFLLSLLGRGVQDTMKDPHTYYIILVFILTFWVLYSACICMVSNVGLRFLPPDDLVKTVWRRALWLRLGMITLFSALSFGSLLAPD